MRDKHQCKRCECYGCSQNDTCLSCCGCTGGSLFKNLLETTCEDRTEEPD